MEEKERYVIDYCDDIIFDTEKGYYPSGDTICKTLNRQDKQIKELEETNKVLSNELTKNNIMKQDRLETCCGIPIYEIPALKEENQQLKEQLSNEEQSHDLCIKSFEEETEKLRKQIKFESDARERFKQENQQLKQQLADKDKEIEQLTEELDYKNFWNDFVDLYTGNKLKTQMLHENWKDKISFAVEQLTLLKNSIVNKMNNPYSVNIKHILSDFDNQIKQLKVKAERS